MKNIKDEVKGGMISTERKTKAGALHRLKTQPLQSRG